MEPTTSRVYVSRHVYFVENKFPGQHCFRDLCEETGAWYNIDSGPLSETVPFPSNNKKLPSQSDIGSLSGVGIQVSRDFGSSTPIVASVPISDSMSSPTSTSDSSNSSSTSSQPVSASTNSSSASSMEESPVSSPVSSPAAAVSSSVSTMSSESLNSSIASSVESGSSDSSSTVPVRTHPMVTLNILYPNLFLYPNL
ncbi:putative protein TPRXL [Jatropha curcas]|uniref:putative protein TPRXL n=1 Tax=Jatropha curcas TaxID=180498 RepID=UPI0018938975|nr:putative protein TPRXL [Jatropha curcas]